MSDFRVQVEHSKSVKAAGAGAETEEVRSKMREVDKYDLNERDATYIQHRYRLRVNVQQVVVSEACVSILCSPRPL